jgi:hypothetical protein
VVQGPAPTPAPPPPRLDPTPTTELEPKHRRPAPPSKSRRPEPAPKQPAEPAKPAPAAATTKEVWALIGQVEAINPALARQMKATLAESTAPVVLENLRSQAHQALREGD